MRKRTLNSCGYLDTITVRSRDIDFLFTGALRNGEQMRANYILLGAIYLGSDSLPKHRPSCTLVASVTQYSRAPTRGGSVAAAHTHIQDQKYLDFNYINYYRLPLLRYAFSPVRDPLILFLIYSF